LDRWRKLIRYVLPATKHVIHEMRIGVSTTQATMIYNGETGTIPSVGEIRKRKNRVTDNRKKPRAPRGWATIKWVK